MPDIPLRARSIPGSPACFRELFGGSEKEGHEGTGGQGSRKMRRRRGIRDRRGILSDFGLSLHHCVLCVMKGAAETLVVG